MNGNVDDLAQEIGIATEIVADDHDPDRGIAAIVVIAIGGIGIRIVAIVIEIAARTLKTQRGAAKIPCQSKRPISYELPLVYHL